jgi:general secretion pathway protein D
MPTPSSSCPCCSNCSANPVTQGTSAPSFIRSQEGEGTGAGPATPPPAPVPRSGGGEQNNGIARRGPAVVARYPGTNAIVVAANADVQRQLGEVIRQLDTRREQVLVEAIIVEIGDLAAKRLGVQFLLAGQERAVPGDQLFQRQPNILTVGGAIANYRAGPDHHDQHRRHGTTTTDRRLARDHRGRGQSVLQATGGFAGGLIDIGATRCSARSSTR